MAATPGVAKAAAMVLADPGGAERLVAYYTPSSVEPSVVVASLKERLPAHMVPGMLVPLQAMPLLPSEKIDRTVMPCMADPCLCHRRKLLAAGNRAPLVLGSHVALFASPLSFGYHEMRWRAGAADAQLGHG